MEITRERTSKQKGISIGIFGLAIAPGLVSIRSPPLRIIIFVGSRFISSPPFTTSPFNIYQLRAYSRLRNDYMEAVLKKYDRNKEKGKKFEPPPSGSGQLFSQLFSSERQPPAGGAGGDVAGAKFSAHGTTWLPLPCCRSG